MVTVFRINVKSICFGNETIDLVFDNQIISCDVSYMGPEPFSTLIHSLIAFNEEIVNLDYRHFHTLWADEPDGGWDIDIYRDLETDTVELMIEYDNKQKGSCRIINSSFGSAMQPPLI